ncbi:hypothetical protein HZC34_06945 [Candidatus Saganbacteria bacterium]|nr:hypothetical protein [Candidatus Saganbacteria bacterium]
MAKCHEKLAEAERSKKDRDKFVEIGHLRSALSSYTEAAQRNGHKFIDEIKALKERIVVVQKEIDDSGDLGTEKIKVDVPSAKKK